MVLVDTNVWVQHFREGEEGLIALLKQQQVVVHHWIIGELALGTGLKLPVLEDLKRLPVIDSVNEEELLSFIDLHKLRGVGWVDVQLLVSALKARTPIWTRDEQLAKLADRFEIGFDNK